ncbi:MAG TPA: imidazole glycerol phosphate synthase subunit HisF [Limnochordales bacterium]
MLIIPAIDLRGGRCVRLVQGDPSRETVYADDPVAVARRFAAAGARRLHVVDLDGAFEGLPRNLSVALDIARAVDIPVQLGGGIRTMAAIEAVLSAGVAYVILGTAAIEQPELVEEACRRFPGRVLVGIDARDGRVAVRGWAEGTGRDAVELAREMGRRGVRQIIFTDIARDGTLQGPNLDALQRVAAAGPQVIASGGVSSLADLEALAALEERGVVGVIIGKALYTGAIDLAQALAIGEAGSRPARGTAAGPAGGAGVKRVIPCLDIRDGRVVKGTRFRDIRDVGDAEELAARYDQEGADEIALFDITASQEGRGTMLDVVRRVARAVSVPLTVGGGVRSLADMEALLDAGAAKVSINTAAVARPDLIREGAERFGSGCIVVSIDCRRRTGEDGRLSWEVVVKGGAEPTGIDVIEWARRVEALGAGELVLNSIDGDGTRQGYDNELNRRVKENVGIPVVASGGAGTMEHLLDGFLVGRVDAVLAASIFHFRQVEIRRLKEYLQQAGVPVRL